MGVDPIGGARFMRVLRTAEMRLDSIENGMNLATWLRADGRLFDRHRFPDLALVYPHGRLPLMRSTNPRGVFFIFAGPRR